MDSTKKWFVSLTSGLVLLLTVSGATLAVPPAVPEAPLAIASGQLDGASYTSYGYSITFDGDRIHLRATNRASRRDDGSEYTGVIVANGPIRDERLIKAEDDDWGVVSSNRVDFRYHTYDGVDGVSFTAHDATRITFRLYRNGHLIETEHIFLGNARQFARQSVHARRLIRPHDVLVPALISMIRGRAPRRRACSAIRIRTVIPRKTLNMERQSRV